MEKIEGVLIKNISIVSVIICLSLDIINISYAQINDKDYIYKKINITSTIQNINEPVFIYENDLITLKFKIVDVKEKLESSNQNTICQGIFNRLESQNNSDHYFVEFNNREQFICLRKIIGELLENGQFILKDKKSNKIIKDIAVGYYRWTKDILYGREGRLYLLPNGEIFFDVIDIVS